MTSDSIERPLLLYARRLLEGLFDGEHIPEPVERGRSMPRVSLTIRLRGRIRGSRSGGGADLAAQVKQAALRAAEGTDAEGPITREELRDASVELWVCHSSTKVDPAEYAPRFRQGIDGVELALGGKRRRFTPSVAIMMGCPDFGTLLDGLARRAGLDHDSWRDPRASVVVTGWRHYVEGPDGKAVQLVGLRPPREERPREDIARRWIRLGTSYLRANQLADGSYAYRYLPLTDSTVACPPNLVRAAGCAYSMAWAASGDDLDQDASSARAAIRHLLGKTTRLKTGDIAVFDDRKGRAELGATALLVLATEAGVFSAEYQHERRSLLETILRAQRSDGSFRCSLGAEVPDGDAIEFFPGEALLALSVAAGRGDPEALQACERAFGYYRGHFRAAPKMAFPLWQADAWRRMFVVTGERRYADFVLEQADWIAKFQVSSHHDGRMVGGITSPGTTPGCATASYAEVLVRAAGVAGSLRDEDRSRRYDGAVLSAMSFLSQLVLVESQKGFFPNPGRALGGVCGALDSFEVRNDFVQHLMTLAVSVIEDASPQRTSL